MNSGDWVENLTAMEYNDKNWTLFNFRDHKFTENEEEHDEDDTMIYAERTDIFNQLLKEIQERPSVNDNS
jgi:hypothetical protein